MRVCSELLVINYYAAPPRIIIHNLKSQLASVAFCGNIGVYNVRNIAVIELPVVFSMPNLLLHGTGLLLPKLIVSI